MPRGSAARVAAAPRRAGARGRARSCALTTLTRLPGAQAPPFPAETVCLAANHFLKLAGEAVRVLAAARVRPAACHARFAALRRTYLYRLHAGAAPPALQLRAAVWHVPRPRALAEQPLDVASMRAAAALLVGRHDFSTFRAAGCAASGPVRTLERLAVHVTEAWAPHPAPPPWLPPDAASSWRQLPASERPPPRHRPQALVIEARAPSFLYHQVRRLVGTLVAVGTGRLGPADVAALLAARDGTACPTMAPAHGLYLGDVEYDAEAMRAPSQDDDDDEEAYAEAALRQRIAAQAREVPDQSA